jgi:phosphoribosyl 1,2-cyclic phosphate phosphodiesterase
MTHAKFIFLGTGGSTGVPVIGCDCAVCSSSSAFNKRWRASGLIRFKDWNFIIDVGPDFRSQALNFGISRLNGVILTHSHFDHIAGIEDLRSFSFFQKGKIPCLLSKDTLEEVKQRYHYMMTSQEDYGSILHAQLDFKLIESDHGEIDFQGLKVRYVSYFQSGMKVNGYILGNLAYISDIREYSEEVTRSLRGIEILILGALRYTTSRGHFTVDEAIAFAREVGAKRTYLTHIGHELDHEMTNEKLPSDIRLAYDGLEIDFQIEGKHG